METRVMHKQVQIGDVKVFYRQAGPDHGLPVLLLHGFPSSSHQFTELMRLLAPHHRLIAPDYPGFGLTEVPDGFQYTFDNLAAVIDEFLEELGIGNRFALYAFDFGGPVGMRLATKDPRRVAALVIQNANAYEQGLSSSARSFIESASAAEIEAGLLTAESIEQQYTSGSPVPQVIDPAARHLDLHYLHHLSRPGRVDAQIALALDYRSNIAAYPQWQDWLRRSQPPTLIAWGRNDPIFTEAGAHAYVDDLPNAELHLLDGGHFALAEHAPQIASLMDDFLTRTSRLRLAVIGGRGRLGSAVASEATRRGHHVTVVGSADVDVTDAAAVRALARDHDGLVVSVKGAAGVASNAAASLLAASPGRVVFVGGGASLLTSRGDRYLDSPEFPPEYRETATDQARALTIFQESETSVEWSYVSPPPVQLIDGASTRGYRAAAQDVPLSNAAGENIATTGDLACAVVDSIEERTFVQERFTIASDLDSSMAAS